MAIRELITLEGTQQVEAQLARINVAGEASIKQFNALSGAGVGAFDPLAQGAKVATQELANVERSTISLGTQMRALRPILHGLGVDLGGIGGLARVANTSIGLAAAAAAGLAVVGLAKLDENAQRAKGSLEDLFKSTEKGQQAFAALQASSKQFGTSVADLTPAMVSLQTALNAVDKSASGFVALREEDLPGGGRQNVQLATDALNNFIKVLRAGRLTQDEAEKSAKAFFDAFKDGGAITSAALKNLPVGTIELLKEALGGAGVTAQTFFAQIDSGQLKMDQFVKLLANFGPQAERAFEAKAIKTFGDETQRILATLNEGFQKLTTQGFSQFLIDQLSGVNQGLQTTGREIQAIIDLFGQLEKATGLAAQREAVFKEISKGFFVGPTLEQAFPPGVSPFPTPEQAGKAGENAGESFSKSFAGKAGFVDTANSLQRLGTIGIAAGNQIAQGADQATAALKRTQNQAEQTGDALEEQGRGGEAFKGRLGQIPVFVPQLAGQDGGAQDAGKKFGAKWVDAVQTEIKADLNINQTLSEEQRQILLKPVLPEDQVAFLGEQFNKLGQDSGIKFSEGVQQTPPNFDTWLAAVQQFGSDAVSQAQQIYDQIKTIFAQPIEVRGQFTGFGGQAEGAPFAAGGKVRGRGTSTSDSNLAWLSVNEWVINARAVQHYGSALFSALNAMTLPRDFIGRFAMGGLVRALNNGNRLATGGQVNPTPFTLVLPDGMRFGGMTATDETVSRLRRYAVKSQLSATGRKPSWVR